MITKEAVINNLEGLHARPAVFFIQKANEFKSSIWIEKDALTPRAFSASCHLAS